MAHERNLSRGARLVTTDDQTRATDDPTRTLVLVDGKRLMPGDPITPVPDINDIPAGMVDRVDVVTGGASAVYGTDAISGVVNFIMKKDFSGVRLNSGARRQRQEAMIGVPVGVDVGCRRSQRGSVLRQGHVHGP